MRELSQQLNSGAPLDPKKATDVRAELDRLDIMLSELKVIYEQYFTGIITLAPDKEHARVKHHLRVLRRAPFKNSEMLYRLRSLETRYNTLNTYWQRVIREREHGVYYKDVFKANLREKAQQLEARGETREGRAEKGLEALFSSYKTALEQQAGRKLDLNFNNFRDTLLKRAHDFKAKTGKSKLTFAVVVRDGKVTLQARVKE